MQKTGVLIVNLGTPHSPNAWDVFHYLNEFLTDERVIDLPWFRRQCLVRGVIVPSRCRQSAELYHRLWTTEGSPLLVHGYSVQSQLQQALGDDFYVVLAMRYQTPSIAQGLENLRTIGLKNLIILPLFPQYASATTGSVHQAVMQVIQSWLVFPRLIFINEYCTHPALIKAFVERGRQFTKESYDHIIFSFHGVPERHIHKADLSQQCLTDNCCQKSCQSQAFCYKAQCYATAHGIAQHMALHATDYTICFQSRLGKEPWIKPYTIDILQKRASLGDKRVLVFCPSFVCDCLETTCEISIEYGELFRKWGGEHLQLVEGLNSHPLWIEALRDIVLDQI